MGLGIFLFVRLVDFDGEKEQLLLEDQSLFLSLAKLAGKVDLNDVHNSTSPTKSNVIESGLVLTRCQQILYENHPQSFPGNITNALSPQELLFITRKQIAEKSLLYDNRVKAALNGLAIAEILSTLPETKPILDSYESAKKVWLDSITCEMETTWNTALDRVDTLTEEELKELISSSIFFGVQRQYHLSKSSMGEGWKENNERENLSFHKNEEMQEEVLNNLRDRGNLERLIKMTSWLSVTVM